MIILKIIITAIVGWFYMWINIHEGKTIHEKSLTKKERQYLDTLKIFTVLTLLYIIGEIWGKWD